LKDGREEPPRSFILSKPERCARGFSTRIGTPPGFFNFITRVADSLGVEVNREYAALGTGDLGGVQA